MSDYRCEECGHKLEYVGEGMVSGYKGYICTNMECPVD